jgi:hypothetical protein
MDKTDEVPKLLCGIEAYGELNTYKNRHGFQPDIILCRGLGLRKCIAYWEGNGKNKSALIKVDPRIEITQVFFEDNLNEFGRLINENMARRKRNKPKPMVATSILKNVTNVDYDYELKMKDQIKDIESDNDKSQEKDNFYGCVIELEILKGLGSYYFDLREDLHDARN